MMNSSLQEYNNLIANRCIKTAEKLKDELANCIDSTGQNSLTANNEKKIMLTLTFMNTIVPMFVPKTEILKELETTAGTMIDAVSQRQRNGFWSRLFGQ